MASLTSSVAFAIKSSPKLSSKTNSRAQFTNNNKSASSFGRKNQSFQIVRAEGEAAPAWSAPKLDPNTPSPIFGGSTGGLLRKAQVRLFAYIDRLIVSLRVNASARWMLPSDFLPLKQTVSKTKGTLSLVLVHFFVEERRYENSHSRAYRRFYHGWNVFLDWKCIAFDRAYFSLNEYRTRSTKIVSRVRV